MAGVPSLVSTANLFGMTAPTVGDYVYVLWDVGTPYGLAGEVTLLAYNVHIGMLVADGYGRIVTDFGDGSMEPFGHQPIYNPLTLSAGADFDQDIYPPAGGVFPSGTTSKLVIVNPATKATVNTWTGTVTADKIRFSVQNAETDPVPRGYKYRIYVALPDSPERDVLWYYGPIERKE